MLRKLALATLVVCVAPASALAQDVVKAPAADKVLGESKAAEGWTPKLTFGATGAYNDSRQVVGTVDGATVQLGLLLDGTALYRSGPSLWETTLKVTESQSRTPQIPEFLKSADLIDLATTYGYRIYDWFGPFVRVAATTSAFQGYSYRTQKTAVTYRDAGDKNDLSTGSTAAGERTKLTDSFEPLLLSEAAGVFANPYADKAFTLKLKAGAGAQELLVKNGYVIKSDAPDTLVLRQLQSSNEAGAVLEAEAEGAIAENIGWKLKAAFFFPLVASVTPEGVDGIERTTADISGKLSVRLAKYLTLDYMLSAKHYPIITKKTWQVQNGLLLTAAVDIL